jgi:hypothetical protein
MPLITYMTARKHGLWVDPDPEAQNDKKMQSKKFLLVTYLQGTRTEFNLSFLHTGGRFFKKNAHNNSLKNVSRQAGSGLTNLTCI